MSKVANPNKQRLPMNGTMLIVALCLFSVLIGVSTGCGGSASSVYGTITLDGQPVAGKENVRITVIFYPESDTGAPAAGKTDENGDYTLTTGSQQGLNPGNYAVAISAKQITNPADAGSASGVKSLALPEYANPKLSGLKAEVKPGSNTFDFDLKSAPKS